MNAASSFATELVATSAWQSRLLGDIVDILDSKRKPITKRDRVAGPYPYYGATGVLDWVSGFIFDEPLVLIGEDGAKWGAGDASAFAVSGKTWVNNHAHVLRPHREIVTDEWLVYYLNAADLTEFISGMTVPKLNQGRLREIPIPIPPLEEQKRIVAVLDQAFAALDRARALAEANLADAMALPQAAIDEIFLSAPASWEQRTLGQVCKFVGGSQPPKTVFEYSLRPGLVRLIQIRDYKTDQKAVYVPSQLAKRFCRADDVMIGRYGPPLFQILRGLEGAYNVALMKAVPNETKISKDFLFYFLKNSEILRYIIDSSSRAAGQAGINKSTIEPYPIAYPTLDEQATIVERVHSVVTASKRAVASCRQKLEDLTELRQSLLHKAFAGELT